MSELLRGWRRRRRSGAERSRRRLEGLVLVEVRVLEELEKSDDAQVQEEAGSDWKTLSLLMSEPLEELEKVDDALEQVTYHQAFHGIMMFAC